MAHLGRNLGYPSLLQEADDNLTLLAVELGAVEHQATAWSISAGGFLKTKDSEVWLG